MIPKDYFMMTEFVTNMVQINSLIELLIEKNVITRQEFTDKSEEVGKNLLNHFKQEIAKNSNEKEKTLI